MVGLADIPCLGKFVDRLSESTVNAVFRGLRYVFRYKSLVDQLTSETDKLNIEKDNMFEKIEEEKANGKIIKDHVLKWQNDVEEIQKSGNKLSPSYSCIWCLPIPNPTSRFRMGRHAAKGAIAVAELTGTGKDYLGGEIAHLPPFENMPKSDTAFEEFQSRKDAYGKLWDGLVNQDSPLVHGIYGMAGVGKTRLMEKFWEDAMKKKIFDKVVRVNVGSENMDNIKLQDQIADRLDCHLNSQDVGRRASQLENSLRNGGKILLILDDVWREIPLDDIIGTSFGDSSSSKGSKILLTSRERVVLLHNKCKHLVEIKTLSPAEALYLFKSTVGPDTINSLQDESLVQKVCDECGHLPLLIHAVGKALKDEPHNSWKDAHDQLKKGKFEKIVGVDPQVYTCIKLSIDNLKDDDAKSCLFLCCLFREDANIDMKMLIRLATGSQVILDGESRVLAMVHYLKMSSLLLDSGEDNETKVHDIIRDVARSIAFTDPKYAFLQVTCNSGYLPSNTNYRTRKLLRLDAETDDVHFYDDLEFPDLHTLWLESNNQLQQFSGGFFRMFANLGFLMLQNADISLERFSLQPLGNLRTLILLRCDMRKTDVSLFPEKLETLCICNCHLPRPMNVANLKYLRKLEIQVWPELEMVSNAISSLSSLEELHILTEFFTDLERYKIGPIVKEISELTRLKSLKFHFFNDDTFQGRNVFSDIDRYNIFVGPLGGYEYFLDKYNLAVPLGRVIKLYGNHLHPWEGLMSTAEELILSYSDFRVSSIYNDHIRAFEDLKRLYINDCHFLEELARVSQDKIQCSLQHGATCFSKLAILKIENCSNLKYLFCNNIAKNLVQLQELSVDRCASMEAIIMNEGTIDGEIINFPKLKSLRLLYMSRLASFYAEKKTMDNSAQHQPLFDEMVAFPSLEKLHIKNCNSMKHLASISHEDEIQNSLQRATWFSKLIILEISYCSKLKYLFCNNIAKNLVQLQELNVDSCDSMEAIVMNEGTSDGKIINFPNLKSLDISRVGRLASFYVDVQTLSVNSTIIFQHIFDRMVTFPSLEKLRISSLPCTSVIWEKDCFNNDSTVSFFRKLTHLTVSFCDKLEIVIPQAMLPRLNNLEYIYVDSCSSLRSMFPPFVVCDLTHLKELRVEQCREMREIVEGGEQVISGDVILFPELSSILLRSLPQLRRLFHGANFEFHVPALKQEEVKVYGCPLLEQIFKDVRVDKTSDMSAKKI